MVLMEDEHHELQRLIAKSTMPRFESSAAISLRWVKVLRECSRRQRLLPFIRATGSRLSRADSTVDGGSCMRVREKRQRSALCLFVFLVQKM